jgi:hypothetical protein
MDDFAAMIMRLRETIARQEDEKDKLQHIIGSLEAERDRLRTENARLRVPWDEIYAACMRSVQGIVPQQHRGRTRLYGIKGGLAGAVIGAVAGFFRAHRMATAAVALTAAVGGGAAVPVLLVPSVPSASGITAPMTQGAATPPDGPVRTVIHQPADGAEPPGTTGGRLVPSQEARAATRTPAPDVTPRSSPTPSATPSPTSQGPSGTPSPSPSPSSPTPVVSASVGVPSPLPSGVCLDLPRILRLCI